MIFPHVFGGYFLIQQGRRRFRRSRCCQQNLRCCRNLRRQEVSRKSRYPGWEAVFRWNRCRRWEAVFQWNRCRRRWEAVFRWNRCPRWEAGSRWSRCRRCWVR